jgi:Zn-dependent protease with chaperone function
MAWAEAATVSLQAHMETTGEVRIRVSPPEAGLHLAPVKLRRDGLSLEAVFDLAPIAQKLAPTDEIQLWLDHPRLGFETSSTALKEEEARLRVVRTARFTAGAAPGPIRVQFGYRLDQLAGIYLPLAFLALALTLLAMSLSRAELGELNRSVFLLGSIFWLGAVSWLQAAEPLRILLFGTPLAKIAALVIEYGPPLFCVAAGAALGSGKQAGQTTGERFAEVIWGLGVFLFPLISALAAVPSMADGDWAGAVSWLVAAPISMIVCRWRIRASAGSRVRRLSGGDLKDRVSELAAKAGRHDVQVYISSSARSQASNAFALLRNGIVFTAPLVQSLTRREVDAVAAHELSHFGHARRSLWAALAVAAVLFETPLAGLFLSMAGGLIVALLAPLIVFFTAMYGARKREFAADAGAVALTGDPRALISALARIARNNRKPLELSAVVEWFSTHPSTRKRIRALALAGRLETAEVEKLCGTDDPGERYAPPPGDGGAIFTLAWQKASAARYAWAAVFGASGAGLFVAWLLNAFTGAGGAQLAGGIIFGCAINKVLAATVMSSNYARLRRKLAVKLGAGGQLVGLAVDSEPRVYNGYRFSDAGFLSFEGGRLCYRSEKMAIGLNPADVVEVSMVAAAPSSWRRFQPMVRFRQGESGAVNAFILHPVEWGATPQRLLQDIERWRAAATSTESTSISGFQGIAGQPFRVPTIAQTVRGFRIPGSVTLLGAGVAGWFFRTEFWPAWYALAITACAYTFMFLPAMLYRPSSPSPVPTRRVDAE